MRDSSARKAGLASVFSLEEIASISAAKALISASENCVSQVEDISQIQCDGAGLKSY